MGAGRCELNEAQWKRMEDLPPGRRRCRAFPCAPRSLRLARSGIVIGAQHAAYLPRRGFWSKKLRSWPESRDIRVIHGTFAKNAAWVREGSPMYDYLQRTFHPRVIETFKWSGWNSHGARLFAAEKLQDHIGACARSWPNERHILIAHSHGGNVALYALRDPEIGRAVHSLICLSTPFVACKPRDLGTYGLSTVWRFIYFGIVFCCLAVGVFIPTIGFELTDKFARLLMGTAIEATVAALLKGLERLYQAYVR
jgi:hypothetical protein